MRLRRVPAVLFAGDRGVWIAAGVVAAPLALLIAFYCLRPRSYFTGTNSVELYSYVAQAPGGAPMCVPGLEIPAGTGRVRLTLISRTTMRPALRLVLSIAGAAQTQIESTLPPATLPPDRTSAAVFTIPTLPDHPGARAASLCVTAGDLVNWGGTPLLVVPQPAPPTVGGRPIPGRIAIWYLPPAGAQRSYVSRVGDILGRAALFRPGAVGPWLYAVIVFALLPALALTSVRCLALAAVGSRRCLARTLFAIAAINFACWALITPPFQAPDEVDHFAYAQSLVERWRAPTRDSSSALARWSSSENLALEDMSFNTDHQVGDTRPPWLEAQQSFYRLQARSLRPRASDGGGYETAGTHGPIYYAALAPAYALASSSPFSQLTLMRLASALIGALAVLFTYLLARELVPSLPWVAVVAALLVAFQPMYGFISGSVNNDVGVNAGAAALELLLIRMLRRGVTLPWGLLTGGLLILLPVVKGTAYSLFAVAGVALIAAVWRHHSREDLPGWAALVTAAAAMRELSVQLGGLLRPSTGNTPGTGAVSSSANAVLEHPLGYLAYVWQIILPRLSFMAPHWETTNYPGFVIFVERGWGAFGWYDVFFAHWVYVVILIVMLAVLPLGVAAVRRERRAVRRNLPELGVLLLTPLAVIAGFEAAFYTTGTRPVIPEFGRYVFPAIGPLAVLVTLSLFAFGRPRATLAGAGLVAGMLSLSYAAQLTTLTGFYA